MTRKTVALCYIRQSRTLDDSDKDSPERQRANIEALCAKKGWTPEWYEDVDGHKSGTTEKSRPGWLTLKKRLGDPDVVALVANDQSRLHRHLGNLSNMIDLLEEHQIIIALAATGHEIDVTTLTGQMFAQFRGLMDAFYAKDVSVKTKDSISYRKAQGKTVGKPPFGTERDDEGYLIPSTKGAWLLPDGTFLPGEMGQEPPEEGAIFRGYHACAERMLTIYTDSSIGMQRIAYRMQDEGWAFRDRWNMPRRLTENDVRRVLANWPEYGGLVWDKPAKDRKAYEPFDLDAVVFVEERAIFPTQLLYKVARIRHERSYQPVNRGVNRESHPYVLSGILHCAHCVDLALKHGNEKLRTRLGGSQGRKIRRYRHIGGVKCGSKNRSVPCADLEDDFSRLIKLLTIKPEALDLMIELAIQSDKNYSDDTDSLEAQKAAAIVRCRRRIDAAINLYRDGVLSRDEYLRDVERNEREIAHWEARTSETQQLAMELTMCMNAVDNIAEYWDIGEDEERQALVHSLFTEVVYDLDTRRIVDFALKPWADRFLMLRGSLYKQEDDDGEGGNQAASGDENTGVKDEQQGVRRNPVWGILRSSP